MHPGAHRLYGVSDARRAGTWREGLLRFRLPLRGSVCAATPLLPRSPARPPAALLQKKRIVAKALVLESKLHPTAATAHGDHAH